MPGPEFIWLGDRLVVELLVLIEIYSQISIIRGQFQFTVKNLPFKWGLLGCSVMKLINWPHRLRLSNGEGLTGEHLLGRI